MKLEQPINFKFKGVDETVALTKTATGSGTFDGNQLNIGQLVIPIGKLAGLTVDQAVFVLSFFDKQGQPAQLNVEIFAVDRTVLLNALNAARSQVSARDERQRLIQAGRSGSYHDAVCPHCQSTNVLTGLPQTPQVYCSFCDTLFSRKPDATAEIEHFFRLCPSCQMYARPREFAIFYFYFLVVTFGFHYDTTIRCSGCMRSAAWKMVFGNSVGVLGFPFALVQLFRSYSTRQLNGPLTGLDSANLLARNGRIMAALQRYDEILDQVPVNAGVKYNIARGLLIRNDLAHAETMFEMSLDDCVNYWPSVHGLLQCLHRQKKHEQLHKAQQLWGLFGLPL